MHYKFGPEFCASNAAKTLW